MKKKNTMNVIKRIYRKLFFTPYDIQARKAGVIIGRDNEIMSKFWLPSEPYLITIGDNCQITKDVKFFTHGGAKVARIVYPSFDCFGKIKVGSNVYIGNNSLIMPGITIGNNVLIAAGSVVTKSVPDCVVIGGNPARIICSFDEYLKKNMRYNTNTKGLSIEDKKKLLLTYDDDLFIKKNDMK